MFCARAHALFSSYEHDPNVFFEGEQIVSTDMYWVAMNCSAGLVRVRFI